jgi:hypothetical protein
MIVLIRLQHLIRNIEIPFSSWEQKHGLPFLVKYIHVG